MDGDTAGRLVIISGPSGAGKSTVVHQLLRHCPLPLVLSVSATTRSPRAGEQDGVDYHFLTQEQFDQLRETGQLIECKEVYGQGYWYGTLRNEVTSGLANGKWVILEIDVQGMEAVVEQYPDAVTIFLHPGSLGELERRLRTRGTESEEAIERRLKVARVELARKDRYQYEVVNDDVDRAVREICDILQQTMKQQ